MNNLKALWYVFLGLVVSAEFVAADVFYITDIEGSRQRLETFFKESGGFELGPDKNYHLKAGQQFVFGGDATDRFDGNLWVLEQLIRIKGESPKDTFYIPGNREITKMRLFLEGQKWMLQRPPPWYDFVDELKWQREKQNTQDPYARLSYILSETMGAPDFLELLKREASKGSPDGHFTKRRQIKDQNLYQWLMGELSPSGPYLKLISSMDISVRIGSTLFVHGGVHRKAIESLRQEFPRAKSLQELLELKNKWFHQQVADWINRASSWKPSSLRPGENLLRDPMPEPFQRDKLQSLMTGRMVDDHNNQMLPDELTLKLLKAENSGIRRLVVGHTPQGSFPRIVRSIDDQFEVINADTSRAPEHIVSWLRFSGSNLDTVTISGYLPNPTFGYQKAKTVIRLGDRTILGKELRDGSRVVFVQDRPLDLGSNSDEDLEPAPRLIFSSRLKRFREVGQWMSLTEAAESLVRNFPEQPKIEHLSDLRIGVYQTVADPISDQELVQIQKWTEDRDLDRILIVIERRSDFARESVLSRIDILKAAIAERKLSSLVEVVGEPLTSLNSFYSKMREMYPRGVVQLNMRLGALNPSVATLDWIHTHGYYAFGKGLNLHSEFKTQYLKFQTEVRDRLPNLPLQKLDAPPFRSQASSSTWFEVFMDWIMDENDLTSKDRALLAESIRAMYLKMNWDFPYPQLDISELFPLDCNMVLNKSSEKNK